MMQFSASQGSRTTGLAARGFSMVELLVAVLVMGIGVLGISALQMVSLQNNRGALFRAEAVQLAYDMMDRIKAHGDPTAYNGLDLGDAPPSVGANCNTSNCTAAQMATFDQAIWKCLLGDFEDDDECSDLRDDGVINGDPNRMGLPEGDGSIAVAGGMVTITVEWQVDGVVQNVVISGT